MALVDVLDYFLKNTQKTKAYWVLNAVAESLVVPR
jgi:predicted DNA-binding protein